MLASPTDMRPFLSTACALLCFAVHHSRLMSRLSAFLALIWLICG